jgi:hypothetical protein
MDDGMNHMMDWDFNIWFYAILGGCVISVVAIILIYKFALGNDGVNLDNKKSYIEHNIEKNPTQVKEIEGIKEFSTDKKFFCHGCGEKLDDRLLKYCPYCGVMIDE